MRGTISLAGEADPDRVTFDSRAEIYRADDDSHEVVTETGDGEFPLGVADVTVSRRDDGDPPVELVVRDDAVEVHNHHNRNGVTVARASGSGEREVHEGDSIEVRREAEVEVGYSVRLRLTVGPAGADDHETVPVPDDDPAETGPATADDARDAIADAERVTARCLPGGPATALLGTARKALAGGNPGRAAEKATRAGTLAERERDLLLAWQDPNRDPDASALQALRHRASEAGVGTDAVAPYVDLADEGSRNRDAFLRGSGPPEEVPGAPDRSLSYGVLEKGRTLGSGGTAEVYEATAVTPEGDLTIALKEPRFEGGSDPDPRVLEWFEREAHTWSRLDGHDNVVGVVDWGTDPFPWIAMEYLDGGTLTPVAGKITPRQAAWATLQVARGVFHAHQHGVAHLDLKPSNVLLRTTGGDTWPVPKVADWGLAKLLLEHTDTVEGYTPEYAAPEQVDPDRFGPTDNQTDVYGIAAIGYALATGRPPFPGEDRPVVKAITEADVTPPSEVAPGVPAELDDVLLTALAKDRDERYETIVYLRDDLRDCFESL